MISNRLYSFIKCEHKKGFVFKNAVNSFALYELLCDAKSTFTVKVESPYRLDSHHISFYEKESKRNTNLSQYHYTAYFSCVSGKKYRLHVYFDINDEPLSFSFSSYEYLTQKAVKQTISLELADAMIEFSRDQCRRVMQDLRQKYSDFLNVRDKEFHQMESQLTTLSNNLISNLDKYRVLHKNAYALLNLLEHHSYDTSYHNMVKLFAKVEAILESDLYAKRQIQLDSSVTHEKIEEIQLESIEPPQRKEQEIKHNKHIFKPLLDDAVIDINTKIEIIDLIKSYHEKLADLLILTEDDGYYVTPQDIHKLANAITHVKHSAKMLLLNLLMKKNIKHATELVGLVDSLPDKWLQLSLKTANVPMLDFLLSHGSYPINSLYLESDLSPVQYCFHRGHTHVECLTTLVKYNASLFCKAENGLPIAHIILSNLMYHPFRQVLINNAATTIGQPRFYMALIQTLENCLNQSTLSLATKTSLRDAINRYHLDALNIVSSSTSRAGQYQVQREIKLSQSIIDQNNRFANSVFNELKIDNDVKNKYQVLVNVFSEYSKKLSKKSLRELKHSQHDLFVKAEPFIKYAISEMVADNSFTYAKAKDIILDHMEDQINFYRQQSELVDVQSELKKYTQFGAAKHNKLVKKLSIRENEILLKKREYESKYMSSHSLPSEEDFKRYTLLTKFTDKLTKFLNTINLTIKALDEFKESATNYIYENQRRIRFNQQVHQQQHISPLIDRSLIATYHWRERRAMWRQRAHSTSSRNSRLLLFSRGQQSPVRNDTHTMENKGVKRKEILITDLSSQDTKNEILIERISTGR